MSIQSGCSYEGLPGQAAELRARLEGLLPTYIAALRRLEKVPGEFDRRGWEGWVDALVEAARADYQRCQAARQQVELFSKFTSLAVGLCLKAVGQPPLPPSSIPNVLIASLPNGEMRPALPGDFAGRGEVALLSWEQFDGLAHKLKERIRRGEVTLEQPGQVSALIRQMALAQPARGSERAAGRR